MAHQPPAHRSHAVTWTVVAILLAAALVGTLWLPFYNRTTPSLGGFPFFYWYQLLWVPIVAILSLLAYLLVKAAQRGGTAAPPGPGTGTGTGEAD